MNRARPSGAASRAPTNANARQPRQTLKATTPSAMAPTERSKKPTPLANQVVVVRTTTTTSTGSGNSKASSHAPLDARRQSSSPLSHPAMTTPSRAAAHDKKQGLHAQSSVVNTTSTSSGRKPKMSGAAAKATATAAAAATPPFLPKQRVSPSRKPSSSCAAETPDSRRKSVSVRQKRTSKDHAAATAASSSQARGAGVKLPPLLREEQTNGSGSELLSPARPASEGVSPIRALSPLHNSVFAHTMAPPPPLLQHHRHYPTNGLSVHSSASGVTGRELFELRRRSRVLAPVSPTSTTSTPPSLGKCTPLEPATRTSSKPASPQSSTSSYNALLHQGDRCADVSASTPTATCADVPLTSSSTSSSQLPMNPTASHVSPHAAAGPRCGREEQKKKSMTTAADLLSAPVTERGGTTASSTKGGTAVDTATTPSPTDEAVTRSEAAEVEDEVEDLGDDKVDADVDADVEDEGDTKGREGTAESLAATETSREDEDDSEVDVSADISGNSDEEGSEEDYSDEESESATDDEDEEYEEEEDEDSDEDEEESDAEPSSTHRRGQRRRSTSSPASRVAVGGGVAAAVAIRAKDKSTPGKPADEGGEDPPFLTKRSNTIVTAKPHHRNSNGKRRKKKDCVEAPRSICTKVSREGDVNVKVVYAVRTRHCFKRFVKEIMTRFSFAKSTDFDMYCIDATGDRVDIDIEEDFEQLLDAFEAAMVRTQEAQNTPTLPQFSTPAGLTEGPRGGYSANASLEERQGKPTSPATAAPRSLLASQLQNSHDGATAGGSFGSAWDYGGSSHPLGTEAEYGSPCGSTSTSGTQKQQLPGSLSPSSGFGASTSVVGGGMENDGKSSASVLRLYVRYSNAYYLVHGYPERPCSPSASPSLFASSNPPGRTTDPNVAALFTNQLQQLSALRPPSDDERRSADQLNALSNGGNGTHAGNGCSYDDSPIVHTLLGSMTGSATGPTALLLPHGSRGKVNEGTSHFFNGLGGTVGGGLYGAGASVRSSHFTGTGVELPSAQNSSFAMLTETQRDAFTCTFMVDGSALVEWRPVSVLGKGSFGTVYEGITLDGKMIAVKVQELPMDDDAAEIKALQTEINLMRSLKHRNIVAYYGCQTRVATTGGQQMEIFLELCHGGSLATLRRKLMKTQHVFAISLVRSYTRQVLHGLAYLHAQHVIHRDIKSDNVLISATGEAKLADFGCSKRFGGGTVQASPATLPFSTSPAPAPPVAAPAAMYQTMVGSPFFMAPEVLREDEGGYTSAADIWSVGCLVIELLGREPWEVTGTNIFQMMFRIAREQGMPTGVPPNCPAMLRSFFERCFERDPAKRATAAELLEHEWMTCPDKLLEEVPTDSVAG